MAVSGFNQAGRVTEVKGSGRQRMKWVSHRNIGKGRLKQILTLKNYSASLIFDSHSSTLLDAKGMVPPGAYPYL